LTAVALSTLAGSMSSMASSTMLDLYKPYFGANVSPEKELKLSRVVTVGWTVLLVASALIFTNTTQTVVELALSIASFTYGGLLGTFLLGMLFRKPTQVDALWGFAAGICVMIAVIALNLVAWTWYTLIGVCATLVVGNVLSLLRKRPSE
jgi:SSS family solute:Na+ symporter